MEEFFAKFGWMHSQGYRFMECSDGSTDPDIEMRPITRKDLNSNWPGGVAHLLVRAGINLSCAEYVMHSRAVNATLYEEMEAIRKELGEIVGIVVVEKAPREPKLTALLEPKMKWWEQQQTINEFVRSHKRS